MAHNPLIVFIASEVYPFTKTGGLADVMGSLPLKLHRLGLNTAVITPFYGRLKTADYPVRLIHSDCPVHYPWEPITADVFQADYFGMPIYLIYRGEYFDRRFYYNTHKGDYFDNCERFIFFSRAVMEWCKFLGAPPAVLHANDWHAGLVPAYLHFLRRTDPFWAGTKSLMTIHNLAFQGRFSSRLFSDSGLPAEAWHYDGVEYWGDFNLLKAGIAYADRITTVSPNYAKEITTPEFGCGLEGILKKREDVLEGILNGVDYDVWNPSNDKFLPATYGPGAIKGKAKCKASLVRELKLSPALNKRPLLGFVGRLRQQKGIDLLVDILPQLLTKDLGVVVLGEGNAEVEEELLGMTERYPDRLFVRVGYTEDLAHRILAGADIFLMPSRYEPCGLTQMYAMRYGTVPVATAVGGLCDTIVPYPASNATGFTFDRPEPDLLLAATEDALNLWTNPWQWSRIRDRAMRQDFSWDKAANEYIETYRGLGVPL